MACGHSARGFNPWDLRLSKAANAFNVSAPNFADRANHGTTQSE
jgi:hypothetical protein